MTTIAYDGETLAADMQLTTGGGTINSVKVKKVNKSYFVDYKGEKVYFLYSLCGEAGIVDMVVNWFTTEGWKMLPKYMKQTVKNIKEPQAINTMYELLHKFLDPESNPDYEFLVIISGYGAFSNTSDQYGFVEVSAPYATGNGGKIALGAMLAGANAREAVKHASVIDAFTGNGITSMKL